MIQRTASWCIQHLPEKPILMCPVFSKECHCNVSNIFQKTPSWCVQRIVKKPILIPPIYSRKNLPFLVLKSSPWAVEKSCGVLEDSLKNHSPKGPSFLPMPRFHPLFNYWVSKCDSFTTNSCHPVAIQGHTKKKARKNEASSHGDAWRDEVNLLIQRWRCRRLKTTDFDSCYVEILCPKKLDLSCLNWCVCTGRQHR